MEKTIKRGDIYYAELNPVIGSEQGGTRPVLIISNAGIAPRLSLPLSRAEYTQRQSCPPILLSEILRVLTRTLLFCLNRYVLLIRSVYRNISVCFPKVRWQELIRLLPLAFR